MNIIEAYKMTKDKEKFLANIVQIMGKACIYIYFYKIR